MPRKKPTCKQTATLFAWHIHHDELMEVPDPHIAERRRDIKEWKRLRERPLRLKLLKHVKGKLPVELVRAALNFRKAQRKYYSSPTCTNSGFYTENSLALDSALIEHRGAIYKLHAKECPRCPWDGTTIFGTGWKDVDTTPARKSKPRKVRL